MLEFVFNSFASLLVVVDPLGLAPIFAELTRGYPEKRKREAALRGTALWALPSSCSSRSRATFCLTLWGSASRHSG